MTRKILLIEDDPEGLQTVYETLRGEGYRVATIMSARQALDTVEDWARQFHLVIIEEVMEGGSGCRLLRAARSRRADLPVLMVTRAGDWRGYADALQAGARDYISHPVERARLLDAVDEALARAS
jgi:DNA-binding NtrC family response regulator